MRKYLTFNGVDCRTYGVYISGGHTFDGPEREYENISVPGRDGDLLADTTRLQNIELTYPAFCYRPDQLRAFRSWILSVVGYARLEDTYNPDEYRLAVYKGGLTLDMLENLTAGNFDLTFECKPQRYLKSGESFQTITSGGTISNPTNHPARPVIRARGAGTIRIGADTITIASHDQTYVDIDCEMMDCFCNSVNLNRYVSFSGNDFPTLPPGSNTVIISSGLTSVQIKPRWWRV